MSKTADSTPHNHDQLCTEPSHAGRERCRWNHIDGWEPYEGAWDGKPAPEDGNTDGE